MYGVRLQFTSRGAAFDFSRPVKDFACTVQDAMVNLGTEAGSDPLFPDRGTYLLLDGVQGRMVNLQWANHAANFAATRTVTFLKSNDNPNNDFSLKKLKLSAAVFNVVQLELQLEATDENGNVIGVINNI